ncbi:MAG: class I SAM-dependent methyltransferase [bacterium]
MDLFKTETFYVIDGGVGTGNLTFILCKVLPEHFRKWLITGIDNSIPMLRKFSKKINERNDIQKYLNDNNLVYGYGDLDFRLPFPNGYYNFVLLSGVIHCLKDWKFTLEELKRIINPSGIICIIAEDDPLIKAICGDIEEMWELNPSFARFWSQYYKLRRAFNVPFDQSLQLVYDLSEVSKFLSINFTPISTISLVFKNEVSFSKFLRIIEIGSFHALGYGVSKKQRNALYKGMEEWCRKQKINIDDEESYNCILKIYLWKRVCPIDC